MAKRDHQRPPATDAVDSVPFTAADAAPGSDPPDTTRDAAVEFGVDPGVEPAGTAGQPDAATDVRQTQLDEARERSLRLQAELENFRKRSARTLEEERRYASLPLLRDLLAVVDNLQRAIGAAEQHEGHAGLLEGVKLVAAQLTTVLQQHHCAPISAEPGELFDPHVHEAVAQFPHTDYAPGHISHVTQAGYQLHDRVIRPAQVIVAAPPATVESDRSASAPGPPPGQESAPHDTT